MAINPQLTKSWIQYLKNNQIVDLKSDPNTGKLNYKRSVTASDLSDFLELKTDYTPDQIANAIHMVLSKKAIGRQPGKLQNKPIPSSDLSTWHHSEMRPGAFPPKQVGPGQQKIGNKERPALDAPLQTKQLGHDPLADVSDVDYRDIPDEPKQEKPEGRFKKWLKKKGLREDFREEQGFELDEKDVEEVFKILSGSQASQQSPDVDNKKSVPPVSSEKSPEERAEELNKLKRVIRDVMSDAQRKSLWRALTDA